MGTTAEYADRVRAWAGQLRAGSTQTWRDFLDDPVTGAEPVDDAGPLPGGAQLELVRRLADRLDVTELPHFAGLADLVLRTPGPGRGLVDAPLPWSQTSGAAVSIGTPAVAPDELPAEEVLRVCAGVLARLLADEPRTPVVPGSRPWRPWRRGFTLLGAPTTVELVRTELRARGLREGGARTTWFVLGGPLEDLMAQRWSARVRVGAGLRWQRMWRTAAANDRVPPGIALPAVAGHVADEFGPSRVHVVLAGDATSTLALIGDVLGVDAGPVTERHDPLATDLLRRVNPVLTLGVGDDVRRDLVRRVWPQIASGEESAPLGAPVAQLDWAIATGEQMATTLRGGRYAVHGDPGLVVPVRRPGVRRSPDPDEVLAHALLVIGRAWQRGRQPGGRPGPEKGRP